jgi:hypothetical protein
MKTLAGEWVTERYHGNAGTCRAPAAPGGGANDHRFAIISPRRRRKESLSLDVLMARKKWKKRKRAMVNGNDQVTPSPEPGAECESRAEIDLARVVYDPEYRGWARDHLNRLRGLLRGPRRDRRSG